MPKDFSFKQHKSRFSRSGQLKLRGFEIQTPTFMPDGTRGAVKGLTPEIVYKTGVGVVLANTYHLHLRPGEATISQLGGIHQFTNQHKLPILTDSGGFQVFSLSKINKITEEGVTFRDPSSGDEVFLSPEKSIQIQIALGADMLVAFDDVVGLSADGRQRTLEAFERTHRWLDRSLAEYKHLTANTAPDQLPLLFGVVQGGLNKSLRKKSLELVQASGVGGIAIGGLSVGESRAEMHDMLDYLKQFYDNSARPRFLLGVGHPIDLRQALDCGIDMLDCVMPTRNARHGSVWISGDKQINLKSEIHAKDGNVIDEMCDCYTCANGFSRGFLRHQFKVGEPLAGTLASIHNIRYLQHICEQYR